MTPTTTEQAATDAAPTFEIVPASADSLAYVLSTWGRAVEANLEAVPQPGFLHDFAPIQARIIKRSKVLTALDSKGRIAGFCVYEPGTLHWIGVRKEHRQQRVGLALLNASKLTFARAHVPVRPTITAWTSDLRHLGLADAPYTPFWLRSL